MILPDKGVVWSAIVALAKDELEDAVTAQKTAQAGATHAESKPENDKDTRGLESSYLARGLANRVIEWQTTVARLSQVRTEELPQNSPIVAGALVALEDDDGALTHYALAPAGGGLKVTVGGVRVTVATPQAPLGKAMLGKSVDDEVPHPAKGTLVIAAIR